MVAKGKTKKQYTIENDRWTLKNLGNFEVIYPSTDKKLKSVYERIRQQVEFSYKNSPWNMAGFCRNSKSEKTKSSNIISSNSDRNRKEILPRIRGIQRFENYRGRSVIMQSQEMVGQTIDFIKITNQNSQKTNKLNGSRQVKNSAESRQLKMFRSRISTPLNNSVKRRITSENKTSSFINENLPKLIRSIDPIRAIKKERSGDKQFQYQSLNLKKAEIFNKNNHRNKSKKPKSKIQRGVSMNYNKQSKVVIRTRRKLNLVGSALFS